MKGYGEPQRPESWPPLSLSGHVPLSLPFCGMEGQAHMLRSPAQCCLTLCCPAPGLGGRTLAASPLPSLSLALPSPCPSVTLPGALLGTP